MKLKNRVTKLQAELDEARSHLKDMEESLYILVTESPLANNKIALGVIRGCFLTSLKKMENP